MEKKKKTAKTESKKTSTVKKSDKKPNKDLQNLSACIRALRKEQGFTNADFFAYQHDFSRAQYVRYEKITGEDIRFTTLMKLIRAFGMKPSEFFKGFEENL